MLDEVLAALKAKERVRKVSFRNLSLARLHFANRVRWHLLEGSMNIHPLGFYHAADELDAHRKIRFHFWPRDWRLPPGQEFGAVHDHTFELNSLIINGILHNQTYTFTEAENGENQVHEVHYERGYSRVEPTEVWGDVHADKDELYELGTAYRLISGELHQTHPTGFPAATMVLAIENGRSARSRVMVRRGDVLSNSFERRPLNEVEKSSIISFVDGLTI